MGRRSRRRSRVEAGPASTTDYEDPEGNVLAVRNGLSRGTRRKLSEVSGGAAATRDDAWQRPGELMFERVVVSWTLAGLPLTGQKELLGRYRVAASATRRGLRGTLEKLLERLNHA